ncbi:MAG TPA: hypothetical protein DIW07_09015 [Lachnospiraceae bacterium]|nr:hypothetical protein [Lachnospiraceae bacterium]
MAVQQNAYPLRIDKITMEKFKMVAKENGRSVNKEIEILLKNVVTEYEVEHGKIEIDEDELYK